MTDTNQTTGPSGQRKGRPPGAGERPRAGERGRMRRRLREQRRMREALLMDLGALVFELHRHGRREPKLLQAKASELSAVDAEVRALSEALDRDLRVVEIVAAGIAGSCESCGMLLSTRASFCASCGAPAKAGLQAAPGSGAALPAQAASAHEGPAGVADDIASADTFVDEPGSARGPEARADPVSQARPEAEPEPEPEPEPQPEPEPEPQAEPEPEPQPDHEPGPAPRAEPVRHRRSMGRLERTLRGKRRS